MADTIASTWPFSSPLVGTTKGDTRFGYGWRKVVLPVAGFRIHMEGDCIHKVENLMASTIATQWGMQGGTKVFVLLPDEFVRHVDAEFLNDELCGLRLHTNMRTSAWFGHRGDTHYEFHADADKCIKALQGTFTDKTARQIGVIYASLAWEIEIGTAVNAVQGDSQDFEFSELVGEHPAVEVLVDGASASLDIRAVVIDTYLGSLGAPASIRVVSTRQYETLHAMETLVTSRKREHWFVLADSERITGVDITGGSHHIESLRIITTLRTSLWFGAVPCGKQQTTSLRADATKRICGFHWSTPHDYAILKLGVVFASNATEDTKVES
jgi:hypothetical protein